MSEIAQLITVGILILSTLVAIAGFLFDVRHRVTTCQKDIKEIKEKLGNGEGGIYVRKNENDIRLIHNNNEHTQFKADIRDLNKRLYQLE